MIKQWFEIKAKGPAQQADAAIALLTELGSPGVLEEEEDGNKILKAYIPADASFYRKKIELRERLKKLGWTYHGSFFENLDWLTKWKEYIKPVRISDRIIVKPTWKKIAKKRGEIIIEIDPGMAFGTGAHASTMMCLKAADRLTDCIKDKDVLDVGTGSGILAIAAAKLGAKKVAGIDIDPEALPVARKNARLNAVSNRIRVSTKSLEDTKGRFSLVFANIIAEELIKIAGLLKEKVAENGFLILSGILKERAKDVEEVYRGLGFKHFKTYGKGEWVCLVYKYGC